MIKKPQKWLHFSRKFKMTKFPCKVLVNFYRGTTESFLTGTITNWHGSCMAKDRKGLQRVIKTGQNIIGTNQRYQWGEAPVSSPNDTKQTLTPARACSPFNCLVKETEVSTVILQDIGSAFSLRLWDSWIPPSHATLNCLSFFEM